MKKLMLIVCMLSLTMSTFAQRPTFEQRKKSTNRTSVKNSQRSSSSRKGTTTKQSSSSYDDEEEGKGLTVCMEMGLGLMKNDRWSYGGNVGVNYWFTEKSSGLYAGARIGYLGSFYSKNNTEMNFHMITLPIELGYAIATPNKNFGIVPHLGLNLDVSVAAKAKLGGQKMNGDTGDFGLSFAPGVRLRLGGFNVGVNYILPLNDKQKGMFQDKGYPEINIGWGF